MPPQQSESVDVGSSVSSSENDDAPILVPERKRRRRAYFPLGKIAKIFVGIQPEPLCVLAELTNPTPTAVRKIVPEVTSEQLAAFFTLVDHSLSPPAPPAELIVVQPRLEPEPSSLLQELRTIYEKRCKKIIRIIVCVKLLRFLS